MQIDRFGDPDEMHVVEDAPDPVPADDEVVVAVISAGVNPLDYKIRDGSSGWVKNLPPDPFPLILGRECCGEVVRVGAAVSDLAVGQRVFGMAPPTHRAGCYAEQVALPARCLVPAPDPLDPVMLGGFSLVGLTAWVATHDLARVSADDVVLVHGGSGGVGSLVVQLAVATGATVYATASARNGDRVRGYGARHVDYATEDFTAVVPAPDVIIDGVYFGTYEPSMDHLKPGGRLVILPSLADLAPARARGIDVSVPSVPDDRARLQHLTDAMLAGDLVMDLSQVFSLAEAPAAHRLVETGHAGGKVVLTT